MTVKDQNTKTKVQIEITIDDDQLQALEKLAAAERLSVSAIVRRAIDAYTGKKSKLS